MTRRIYVFLGLLTCLVLQACSAFNQRANTTTLSREQEVYYSNLGTLIREQRELLVTALDQQLEADRARRADLVEWERDLAKAEILLKTSPTITGNRALLLQKVTESDLSLLHEFDALDAIRQDRRQKILNLYDALGDAVEKLKQNSEILTKYLSNDDEQFALLNLDIEGTVRVISTLRDIRDDLRGVEQRSDDKRKQQDERLQKNIDRVRDLLISILERKKN